MASKRDTVTQQEFLMMPFYLVHKEVRFTEHIVQVELAFFSCSFSNMSESKESGPTACIILYTFACSLKFHKVAHFYSFFYSALSILSASSC